MNFWQDIMQYCTNPFDNYNEFVEDGSANTTTKSNKPGNIVPAGDNLKITDELTAEFKNNLKNIDKLEQELITELIEEKALDVLYCPSLAEIIFEIHEWNGQHSVVIHHHKELNRKLRNLPNELKNIQIDKYNRTDKYGKFEKYSHGLYCIFRVKTPFRSGFIPKHNFYLLHYDGDYGDYFVVVKFN